MASALRNVVVVGGSYVGCFTAKELAKVLPTSHRVVLIDPHSHFNHLFAFPRFAVLPGHEHKAFIPYSGVFLNTPDPSRHAVVQAKVVSLKPRELTLDREWQGSRRLAFDFLVAATGTQLSAPGTMPHYDKKPSAAYLQQHQQAIKDAKSVAIVGGGAVGVQMACDIKELYPDKDVTLVHSREQLMPLYDARLSDLIKARFAELGVRLEAGSRVAIPPGGFNNAAKPVVLTLQSGRTLAADLVVQATGQTPNVHFLDGLAPSRPDQALVNPRTGFVRVRPTLQFEDPAYPHLFAVGDVADTGAHKAAKPGAGQAAVVAKNIAAMMRGEAPSEVVTVTPPAIHMSLGLAKNVVFRNPNKAAGETEPTIKMREDGQADMKIDSVWEKRGVMVSSPSEYHL